MVDVQLIVGFSEITFSRNPPEYNILLYGPTDWCPVGLAHFARALGRLSRYYFTYYSLSDTSDSGTIGVTIIGRGRWQNINAVELAKWVMLVLADAERGGLIAPPTKTRFLDISVWVAGPEAEEDQGIEADTSIIDDYDPTMPTL